MLLHEMALRLMLVVVSSWIQTPQMKSLPADQHVHGAIPTGAKSLLACAVSLMVMIPAFQAGGPTSIPGRRTDGFA